MAKVKATWLQFGKHQGSSENGSFVHILEKTQTHGKQPQEANFTLYPHLILPDWLHTGTTIMLPDGLSKREIILSNFLISSG